MKKRIIAIILAVVLIFGAVVMISGCNKDDDAGTTQNESTNVNNTEENTDEPSTDEKEDASSEKESANDTENKTEEDKTEPTQTEQPTDNDEPATCKTCGNVILSDSYSGDLTVGEYCDGKCDEWLGELEI